MTLVALGYFLPPPPPPPALVTASSMPVLAGSAVTSETRFLSADQPDGEWKVILPRENGVEYDIKHRGDHFFIEIRDSERPNSEVLVAPVSNPTQTQVNWMLRGLQALPHIMCIALQLQQFSLVH